jgi:hypothetical protein
MLDCVVLTVVTEEHYLLGFKKSEDHYHVGF